MNSAARERTRLAVLLLVFALFGTGLVVLP